MAKRRKTKRQKVISDSRHLVTTERLVESQESLSQNLPLKEHTYTLEDIKHPKSTNAQQIVSVSDYKYLINDIRKITVVTILITLTELGIFWSTNGF